MLIKFKLVRVQNEIVELILIKYLVVFYYTKYKLILAFHHDTKMNNHLDISYQSVMVNEYNTNRNHAYISK